MSHTHTFNKNHIFVCRGKHMGQKRESKERGIIRIFVASPGDVGGLRTKILETMERKFRQMGYVVQTGYRIEVMGWEDIAPASGLAQDIINEILLPKADIIVGLFKHKLGTPIKDLTTGNIRSLSGTVEEVMYALTETKDEQRPLLMAYFHDGEPDLGKASNPLAPTIRENWQQVQDFKKLLGAQALYGSFGDDEDKELMRLCDDVRKNVEQYFAPIVAHISHEVLAELKAKAESTEQLEELKKKYAELEAQLASQPEKRAALEELEQGDFEKTEESLLATLRKQEEQLEKDKEAAAQTNFELGRLKELELQYKEAEKYYAKAVELIPNNSLYLNEYGYLLNILGRPKTALEAYQRALEIDLAVFGDKHPKVALKYNNIGSTYQDLGDANTALENYQRALEIDLAVFGEKHPNVAREYNNIGSAYKALGDAKAALQNYQRALEIDLAVYGEKHPNVAIRYNNIGSAYQKLGDAKAALKNYQRALEIDLAVFGNKHPNVAREYNNIGLAYNTLGDAETALENYQQALEIDLAVFGDKHPNVAIYYNNIGLAYNTLGDAETALKNYQQALEIHLAVFGDKHPNVAIRYNNIGYTHQVLGDTKPAMENFQKALSIFKEMLGEKHPNTQTVARNIEYLKQRNPDLVGE